MTNSKTTKRALFSSVVALLLCFTMLLGTTFAWFTDSASSDTNIISAGNLDVELYHADKAQPTDELVGSSTKLFDDVNLWEPGAIVWEKLTVKNNGTLALKYNLSVNVTQISEVNGKSLADVLKVAVLTEEPTRANVAAAATQSLASFNLKSDKALTAGNSDVVYVAIYWEPSANDNNYNVASGALNATLGVTLMATQYTSESDSFDNQYDKDATYDGSVDNKDDKIVIPADAVSVSDETSLKSALANADVQNIKLVSDIDLSSVASVTGKKAIYGQKYSIGHAEAYAATLLDVPADASLTLIDVVVDGGNDWNWIDGQRESTDGWIDGNEEGCVDAKITSNGVKLTDSLIESQGDLVLGKNCVIKNAYYIGSWGTNYIVNVTDGSLKLNGAVIEKNLGTIFYAENANVMIDDCYIADNMIYNANKGGVFNLSSTNCTMNGGKIVNNDGHVRSGFIFGVVNESKLTINDCLIENNHAKSRGSSTSSVICCESGGDFDMNGGSIKKNVGMLAGALSARWVLNEGASQSYINLNGGVIGDNSCLAETWHNAEVFIRDTVTTIGNDMTIVGNVVVDSGVSTLTNNGTVDGDVYVQNASATMTNNGTIDGDVTVTAGTFNNNGTVTGTITKAE